MGKQAYQATCFEDRTIQISISGRAGIRTQVSLAPKFMLCPHLGLSVRQHPCVPGTRRQVWQESLPLAFVEFTSSPAIPASLSGRFACRGRGGSGEERFLCLPLLQADWQVFLAAWEDSRVTQARVLNLPCQPCLPSPPQKVYGRL